MYALHLILLATLTSVSSSNNRQLRQGACTDNPHFRSLELLAQILVLDNGSIAEFDDPAVLLSNPESRFARLAATQGIYHPDFVPQGVAVKELSDGTVMVVEDLVDV
jgi:hypothetical protein